MEINRKLTWVSSCLMFASIAYAGEPEAGLDRTQSGTSGINPDTANEESMLGKTETAETAPSISEFVSETLDFSSGESTVTAEMQSKLQSMLTDLQQRGEVDHVKVVAWADQERSGEQELEEGQRDLAKNRASNIEKIIKDSSEVNVETHNMSERAGFFARMFDTKDAELKAALAREEGELDEYTEKFVDILREEGGANKVVVIARLENTRSQEQRRGLQNPGLPDNREMHDNRELQDNRGLDDGTGSYDESQLNRSNEDQDL